MPPLLIALGQLLISANDLEDAFIELSAVAARRTRAEVLAELGGATMGTIRKHFVKTYRTHITDETLLGRLSALESRVEAAVEQRNNFIHASWRPESSHARVPVEHRRRPRKGATVEVLSRFTPTEVYEIAGEIDAVAVELWRLLEATATSLGLELPEDLTAHLAELGAVDA